MTYGNLNIVNGLESLFFSVLDNNIQLITGVAGYPTTELMTFFVKMMDTNAYWMTNEKASMEKALGASVSGQRALVIVKHVGMNILSDPLITATYHTIGAGIIILTGDDVRPIASQNAQDSRFYGNLVQIALFDPSTVQDAYDIFGYAYELSERSQVPVIIRITDRLLHSKSELVRSNPKLSTNVFDNSIWKLTTKGKQQRFHNISLPILQQDVEKSAFNMMQLQNNDIGIISSGYASTVVNKLLSNSKYSMYSHFTLQMVSPFPFQQVKKFIDAHKTILIVEESEAYIESYVKITGKIKGKLTGHLPYGQIENDHIMYALNNISIDKLEKYTEIELISNRGSRPICETCPFMAVYLALKKINVMVAGDMGCSIKAACEPLNVVNTGFALGSSISTACGFKNKGIALIGDFALAHSGIVGIINAIENKDNVVVIILHNDIAAMTGGQHSPNLKDAIQALVKDVIFLELLPFTENSHDSVNKLEKMIKLKLKVAGINIIYITGPCTKYKN